MKARTRSPLRKVSRGSNSSRRSSASPRPRSTVTLPNSTRFTRPLMISPLRSLNSSNWRLRSALAHLLHDHLLGGLRGDAAEIDRRQLVDDEVAGLQVRVALLRPVDRDLRRLVLDGLHHLAQAGQADLAGLAVDVGADVVLVPVFGAAGLLDGLLHRVQHLIAIDALFAGDRIGDLQQLHARNGNGLFHDSLPQSSFCSVLSCSSLSWSAA